MVMVGGGDVCASSRWMKRNEYECRSYSIQLMLVEIDYIGQSKSNSLSACVMATETASRYAKTSPTQRRFPIITGLI
jgi:hypothetical protein